MLPAVVSPSDPYRTHPVPTAPPEPFEKQELLRCLLLPHRAIELVLVQRQRLAQTVALSRHRAWLVVALLWSSVALALPFGLALGTAQVWCVAALFVGAVLICFPSLHVFSSYLGCGMTISQNLVMALLISAVASMFALGFAPIVWFVDLTTPDHSNSVSAVSLLLLAVALLAGAGHLSRAVMSDAVLQSGGRYRLMMLGWQCVLLFVAHRLAAYLGLS